ncbi:MAG: helix-turn-helix domain-containing protein [Candidatus Magasanikbacteria bacterium]|jgi:cytoskeletal protein RodZ
MSIFCYKKIDTSKNLGWELKTARENKLLSLEDVAKKTHVPLKYLEAFENNRFFVLPKSKSHRQAYMRELCDLYDLSFETITYKFNCEGGLKFFTKQYLAKIDPNNFQPFSLIIKNIALISFVLFFVIYLGWQIHGIITPPKLIVYSPIEGQVSNRAETSIQGETDKESQLKVNGKDIKVNEQGKFSDVIILSNGVNTITLSTTKKHGKTTTVIRHVVVTVKEPVRASVNKDLGTEAGQP